MKRFLAAALIAGVSSIGFVGCAEKTSTKTEQTTKTPGGTTTTTEKIETKKTGDNPP